MCQLPRCTRVLFFYYQYAFLILYPLVLLPLLLVDNDTNELKGAYLLLLMSGYWITGFIPLYVTALLPVLYAPLMGLVTSTAISRAYMSSSNLLFLCCMILAVATENTNLHRRIAMAFVRKMGSDPRLLILSVMLPTWFLSMWMNNTSTTVMMLTIVEALLTKLDEVTKDDENEDLVLRENTGSQSSIPLDKAPVKSNQLKEIKRFSTGISLSIAYAASCGGIATITGTATNTIFYGLISSRYGDSTPLNFGSWMAFAFPISLLCLLAVWIVICLVYLGPRAFFNCAAKKPKEIDPNKDATEASQAFLAAGGTVSTNPEHGKEEEEEEKRDASVNITSAVQKISREESLALGSIKFGELSCLVIFALLIVLWIGREPGIPGWSRLMPTTKDANGRVMQYVDDVQATVFFVILVFLLPATNPLRVRLNEAEGDDLAFRRINTRLISWSQAQRGCSWGVLLLMGGGYALSKVIMVSGLSNMLSEALNVMRSIPSLANICIVALLSGILTQFITNAATVTILAPIVFDLCQSIQVHPFLLSIPLTIATSLSFMLPASTPPNAIIFSKGRVPLLEMVKTGFLVFLVTEAIVLFCTMTYVTAFFHLNEIPSWANTSQPHGILNGKLP
uniref:Solute carrier family 13 member 5 n=2 Tax=Schistocephalus solidus TaxID=70667 RepID=A0A0X3NP27_SCHSO